MNFKSRIFKKIIYFFNIGNKILKKKDGFIVLMYHSVHNSNRNVSYPYSISIDNFEKQILYLKRIADFVSFDEIIGSNDLINDQKLKLILTFDDGYKNNYSLIYPILEKNNIPAIIFLTINFINCEYKTFLNWSDIIEMNSNPLITFGSHCCFHSNLTSLRKEDAKEEISKSKFMLENKLGNKVNYFSYPSGGYNQNIIQSVKDCGYKVAFKDRMHFDKENNNPYSIGRVSVDQSNENIDEFIASLATKKAILKIGKE